MLGYPEGVVWRQRRRDALAKSSSKDLKWK
jgi:hypothetical protein